MFTLHVEDDQGRKTEVAFSPPGLTIGRDKDNHVRLNERNVSRKHARLSAGNGGLFIEDLDSYNGVRINGDRITGKAAIFAGDRIQLGDFLLQVAGDSLRSRPEEVTQKTQLPRAQPMGGDEVTNTEPMVVAPVGTTQPNGRAGNNGGGRGAVAQQQEDSAFDESTALIRLNDNAKPTLGQVQSVSGPNPRLVCTKGPMAGREWPISKTEVVIGRGAENDIQIDHRSMSRQHAKLVLAAGACRIVDMGSANGTLVNGEQYAQVDLKRGDTIELGHVKLRVVWPGEPMPRTEAPADTAFDESTEVGRGQRRSSGSIPTEQVSVTPEKSNNKFLLFAVVGGVACALAIILWVVLQQPEQAPHVPQAAIAVVPTPVPTPPPAAPPPTTPPPPAAPQVDASDFLRRANAEMANENWDQAAHILESGLAQAHGNQSLRAALDRAEMERGAKATYDAALSAYQKGDYGTAKELFGQIAETSTYYARAQKKLSEPKMRGAMAKAQPRIKAEAKSKGDPRPPPPEPERPKEPEVKPAPVDAPATASESPRDKAKKLFDQGNQALKQNKVREAIETYMEATKIDPKFALPHRGLGIAHARAGNGDAAVEHYRLYLQLFPSAPDADAVKKIIHEYEAPGD